MACYLVVNENVVAENHTGDCDELGHCLYVCDLQVIYDCADQRRDQTIDHPMVTEDVIVRGG